jgi:hypothetical protein
MNRDLLFAVTINLFAFVFIVLIYALAEGVTTQALVGATLG